MLRPTKASIEFVCAAIYAAFSRCRRTGSTRVVLYYHGVDKAFRDGFRRQMAYLARKCLVVTPSDISSASAAESRSIVAVTFDDAFVSVLENALPVLSEYGLPAGIFVPTGNLGRRPDWTMAPDCPDKDETVMDERQITALDREGFEIFSHTVSHPVLTGLNASDLETELIGSKKDVERIVGHDVPAVSYPHGACDDRVCEAARKAGYRFGFTIDPRIVDDATDSLRIGRFAVSPRDALMAFKLKANGAYRVVSRLRGLKRSWCVCKT